MSVTYYVYISRLDFLCRFFVYILYFLFDPALCRTNLLRFLSGFTCCLTQSPLNNYPKLRSPMRYSNCGFYVYIIYRFYARVILHTRG